MLNLLRGYLSVGLLVSFVFSVYAEDDPHAHHRHQMQQQAKTASEAKVSIPNVQLLTQHDTQVDLKKDVIGDDIAVVSFAYTTCTTICPVVTAIFSQVQDRLGDKLGKQVKLVTITVDPNRDTPARLLKYSKKHGAKDGWTWLTGKKDNVIKALNAFGAYTVNFEDHPAMILIGDGKSNTWYRYYGFSAPADIENKVNELLQHRQHASKG
jgi:protein SCO1/2